MSVNAIYLVTIWVILAPSSVTAAFAQQLGFDHASTTQNVVALTFDADMTSRMLAELKSGKVASWYNEDIIAILRKEHVPATLFLTGLWIETYAAATKDLSNDPLFELANHSYSHAGFRSPCYGLAAVKETNEAAEVQKTDVLTEEIRDFLSEVFPFSRIVL